MGTFWLILPVRTLSMLGSRMSAFALTIWLYRQTGLVTLNGVLVAATMAPEVYLAPIAGAFVDRYDRGKVLFAGQLLGGLCSLGMLLAAWRGVLSPALTIAL